MSLSSFRNRDYILYECSREDGVILVKYLFERRLFYAVSHDHTRPQSVIVVVSAHCFRDEQHLTYIINDVKWEAEQ